MSATIFAFISTFALTSPATLAQPTTPQQTCQQDNCDEGEGEGEGCHGLDLEGGLTCGLVVGLDFWAECNPLAVEAACYAELGVDCSVEAFAECTASLVAECQAALEADGAVFCDGEFKGHAGCLGELEGDYDHDDEGCIDGEEVDIDLDLDLCLDIDLDLNLDCAVEVGAECYAACDPISVEAWCYAELGDDCTPHAFAACEAEVLAQCWADCEVDGALFCDGGLYVGADVCLGIDIGILHL